MGSAEPCFLRHCESIDHRPAPTIRRKRAPSHMQISVRDSCVVDQKPDFASIGIFVVRIATEMSMSRGIAARRVKRPRITRPPQAISTAPTNGAKKCGAGMPIFTNRPTPSAAGNRNF